VPGTRRFDVTEPYESLLEWAKSHSPRMPQARTVIELLHLLNLKNLLILGLSERVRLQSELLSRRVEGSPDERQ
jgi:hypothetical protein